MNRQHHYYAWPILLLALTCWLTGCTTIGQAKRYGEFKYLIGLSEGYVKGATPWEEAYRTCESSMDRLAAESARETDRRLGR